MSSVGQEIEISQAAARAYAGLLRVLKGSIGTHASHDGGLICELRVGRARPLLWRIRPDGAVVADSRYSFVRGAFVTAPLPQEL
ncbi:MAG TPA: hypothetical protein VE983_13345 [Solirubrobacteraceae bacterium]|nr:hypothetical protein [Solirubrobacteraceae bacterium]